MLTADQAAAVAQRHGLSLMDAAGLISLADTIEDADRIAAQFAGADTQPDPATEMRDYAAALFGRATDPVEPDPPPSPPNSSPKEGTSPSLVDQGAREVRRFAARLFNTPDRDNI